MKLASSCDKRKRYDAVQMNSHRNEINCSDIPVLILQENK